MKSLKEALLNRPKNIDVSQVAVAEYININYKTKGKLTYKATNGIYIVNCNGDVNVENKEIGKLTEGFVWEEVKGDFDCSLCWDLKSLEGAPKKVGGTFNCSNCQNLKSIVGAPKEVGLNFICSDCKNLISLKGAPEKVGEYFYCYNCQNLTSLKGAPKKAKKIVCDVRLNK